MGVDWKTLFSFDTPVLELMIRGSVMYLALFAALRIFIRRESGALNLTDLLLLVLIADAAQNAMAGEYRTIPDGFVLCGTLIGWSYLLDWLSFRSRFVRRCWSPRPCRSFVTVCCCPET